MSKKTKILLLSISIVVLIIGGGIFWLTKAGKLSGLASSLKPNKVACGNCICESGETPNTCKKDCDFFVINFKSSVTEENAKKMITSCGATMESWFPSSYAASAKVNRCTTNKFRTCFGKFADQVSGWGVSKRNPGEAALVVFNYKIGEKYGNPGKCNLVGWKAGTSYVAEANSCAASGKLSLTDGTVCFSALRSEETGNRGIHFYVVKRGNVSNFPVNTGDSLVIPATPDSNLKTDALPLSAVISDACLDPNHYTDQQLQDLIKNLTYQVFPECAKSSFLPSITIAPPTITGEKICLDGSKPSCLTQEQCYCISK